MISFLNFYAFFNVLFIYLTSLRRVQYDKNNA